MATRRQGARQAHSRPPAPPPPPPRPAVQNHPTALRGTWRRPRPLWQRHRHPAHCTMARPQPRLARRHPCCAKRTPSATGTSRPRRCSSRPCASFPARQPTLRRQGGLGARGIGEDHWTSRRPQRPCGRSPGSRCALQRQRRVATARAAAAQASQPCPRLKKSSPTAHRQSRTTTEPAAGHWTTRRRRRRRPGQHWSGRRPWRWRTARGLSVAAGSEAGPSRWTSPGCQQRRRRHPCRRRRRLSRRRRLPCQRFATQK